MKYPPPDGTVINGCFWIKDQPWFIEKPNEPLNEYLANSLKEQREYIERLTQRANDLEEYLNCTK